MSEPTLTDFERLVLTAFYKPTQENLDQIHGPERRDLRKAAIERLVELELLNEVQPFTFQITHEGHTLLDNRK